MVGRTGTRSVIDEAAVQLIADDGLDAATVRKVAARAGVSPGRVQHHYPTKQAMLLAAMARVETTFRQRLPGRTDDPVTALRALSRQILPLDADRTIESRVWLAFVARAAVDPAVAAVHAASWQQLEDAMAQLLATAAGHSGPDSDDRDRAAILLAGLDGLAATAVSDPRRLSTARIEALADRMVGQALSARGQDG
jgi:AcrR family transcriptional regulator